MLERLLVRPVEAAAMLGISRSKTYELIQRGEIRVVRVDGATCVPVDELKRFVDRLRAEQFGENQSGGNR